VAVEQAPPPAVPYDDLADVAAAQHGAPLNSFDEPVATPAVEASLSASPFFLDPGWDVVQEPQLDVVLLGGKDVSRSAEFTISPGLPLSLDEAPSPSGSGIDSSLSFMRSSGEQAKGAHPLTRLMLVALCVLFGAMLLLQVVVQERDRLVAGEPSIKPILESVCTLLTCKISPLRQIDALVIESSSFTKVRPDVYRLNFTLKNTAALDIAAPALELTLTDLQERAVIRRVVESSHFALKSGVLVHGEELTASLLISVKTQGMSERVSGYRLLTFYP